MNGHAVDARNPSDDVQFLFEKGSAISNVRSGDIITIGGTSFAVDIVDCSPNVRGQDNDLIWKEGEAARKSCPVPCPS